MKVNRSYLSFNAAVIMLLLWSVCSTIAAAGAFIDRDGNQHKWSIGQSHQLEWDGAPFIPFGVEFTPKSFAPNSGNAEFEADKRLVEELKAAQVTDVLITPGQLSIVSVPTESVQRIVDLLEANGITYGLEISDPPYSSLGGYVINAAVNRVEGVRSSVQVSRQFPNAKDSIWLICDAATHEVDKISRVPVVDGTASVNVSVSHGANKIVLFYPEQSSSDLSSDPGFPDMWTDYDRHRDRLMISLQKVKFGKGLRYFIDPFAERLKLSEMSDTVFPTSKAFRIEYSSWLSKRYSSTADLGGSWGLGTHELSSFETAASVIPLWRKSRGVPYAYDTTKEEGFPVIIDTSAMWSDFLQFRAESISGYMNSLADVIKRTVADVPVVYTASSLDRIFAGSKKAGFDGLAVPVSATENDVIEKTGYVFSLAESSPKPTWILSRIAPLDGKFENKSDLFSILNDAHSLGSKACYVEYGSKIDASVPWISEYASLGIKDRSFVTYKPHTIYYPQGMQNVSTKKFKDGSWWLPKIVPSVGLHLGSSLSGYFVPKTSDGQGDAYIWSLNGTQGLHFQAASTVTIVSVSGEESQQKAKKGKVEIQVGPEPIIVRGIPLTQFIPAEVVEKELADLEKSITAVAGVLHDVTGLQMQLERAKELYKNGQLSVSFDMAHSLNAQIHDTLAQAHVKSPAEN